MRFRRSPSLVALLSTAALVFSCKGSSSPTASAPPTPDSDAGDVDAAPSLPPRVCKMPASAPPQPWFADATADVKLAKTDTFEPLAVSTIAADLDGDGFA